jgi:hypothetical protein
LAWLVTEVYLKEKGKFGVCCGSIHSFGDKGPNLGRQRLQTDIRNFVKREKRREEKRRDVCPSEAFLNSDFNLSFFPTEAPCAGGLGTRRVCTKLG